MGYLIMPSVGSAYKFVFESRFSDLTNVYEVKKIMTYNEFLADGRNILSDFYEPCGLSQSDVDKDLAKIRESKILKLHKPDHKTDDDIYAPLFAVENVPDCNVKRYYNVGMVSKVGITEDPNDLDYMKNTFVEVVESSLGITPDPIFTTIGEGVWLTDDEYKAEVAKRDKNKLKVMNFFKKAKELEVQLSEAKTKINAYEQLIVKLHKENEALRQQLGE